MKFLTTKYWFGLNPGSLIPWAQKGLLFFSIILFGFAIFAKYFEANNISKIPKVVLRRLFSFFITNGIIGLVLLFFTYEHVTFLSSRFWFILWIVGMMLYLYNLNIKTKCSLKRKEQYKKNDERKKYIP